MDEKEAREILMIEYQVVSQEFIHHDEFFWTKARFFLSVEGVALLTTSGWLVYLKEPLRVLPFVLLTVFFGLNLFLCYVWYVTGVRSREYKVLRGARARDIEKLPLMRFEQEPLMAVHRRQEEKLAGRPSTSYWERKIPIAFTFAWSLLLLAGLWLLLKNWSVETIVGILITAFCIVVLFRTRVEKTN